MHGERELEEPVKQQAGFLGKVTLRVIDLQSGETRPWTEKTVRAEVQGREEAGRQAGASRSFCSGVRKLFIRPKLRARMERRLWLHLSRP